MGNNPTRARPENQLNNNNLYITLSHWCSEPATEEWLLCKRDSDNYTLKTIALLFNMHVLDDREQGCSRDEKK